MNGAAPARVRLFVALSLPQEIVGALSRWRDGVIGATGDWRPVAAEAMHVTLCFLGWRPEAEVSAIARACARVAELGRAPLALSSPVWLPPRRPSVLAVELEDPEGVLSRVQSALAQLLAAGGWFTPERRPFLAHVTVARLRRGGRSRPAEPDPPAPVAFMASQVVLYRSRTLPGGARYEPLETVSLAGGARPWTVDR